jgi:hypothetical protein
MSKRKFVIVADEASDKLVNSIIIIVISIVATAVFRDATVWYVILTTIGILMMWELIEIKHRLRRKM